MKTFKATAKKLKEGMQVEVESNGFKMLFDEPEQMGGTNKAINPMSQHYQLWALVKQSSHLCLPNKWI